VAHCRASALEGDVSRPVLADVVAPLVVLDNREKVAVAGLGAFLSEGLHSGLAELLALLS
jgi:hypothetical protein